MGIHCTRGNGHQGQNAASAVLRPFLGSLRFEHFDLFCFSLISFSTRADVRKNNHRSLHVFQDIVNSGQRQLPCFLVLQIEFNHYLMEGSQFDLLVFFGVDWSLSSGNKQF